MGDVPQTNYQSNQNFDPDVRKMYKHFVTGGTTPDDNENGQNVGIDDLRGQISVNVTGQNSKNLIASLNIDPTSTSASPTPNTTTAVQSVQESRCHTFYRIIGFPVVSSDKSSYYNPGLDIIKEAGRSVNLKDKISIASNIDPKFSALSQARESYATTTSQIFSVPESVEAGILALTSGTYGSASTVNIRKFAFTINSNDPFDFEVTNQSYSSPGDINSTSTIVGDKIVSLSLFQDGNGNFPNQNIGDYKVMHQHRHVIKPFMVDPRIDFSIWASESKTISGLSKRIAVPFVPDASYLKTSDTATAERPLLEKIISDRFSNKKISDTGTATTDVINYVKGFKNIQSITIGTVQIGDIFSGSVFKVSQQQAFAQYLSTIQALMFKLVDSMRIIHAAQGTYYWLPSPSINGPEGGCSIRNVPINLKINPDLITVNDFNIINNQAQIIISNINPNVAQSTAIPDPGSYAFSNYKLTFDSGTSNSQGSWSSKTQETLTNQRKRLLSKAGDALQIVEMIMGEFSGLGLADIVAIIGALYVMPENDLLGFLDADAVVRAEKVLNYPKDSLKNRKSDISTSMLSLTKNVNGFYQIMDQVFQDYLNNNALNL